MIQQGTIDLSRFHSILFSTMLCFFIATIFMIFSEDTAHWYLVPVLACGALIGIDAFDWMRGRRPLLDPVGIIGLLGLHFYFLAPLLHVAWNHWTPRLTPPSDWRDWLGGMALVNLVGIAIYRFVRWRLSLIAPSPYRVWRVHDVSLPFLLWPMLAISAAAQVALYVRYGGISGFIAAYEARYESDFSGLGIVFVVAEAFPILAFIGFALWARRRQVRLNWLLLILLLMGFLALRMFFGGLRGSRGNTIWALFWAVGILHIWIRPVPRALVGAGLAFLLLFMYVYGFYKSGGREGLAAAYDMSSRLELAERTNRTFDAVLLQDFGRADLHALLLWRTVDPRSDYEYGWGRTYLASGLMFIPRSVWPERPPSKAKEGTEAQYGMNSYKPGKFVSTRAYGIAGEAMLNFGPVGAVLSFVILAAAVAFVERLANGLAPGDVRWLLFPFAVNACFVLLIQDSDTMVFFLVKNGFFPALLIFLASVPLVRTRAGSTASPQIALKPLSRPR